MKLYEILTPLDEKLQLSAARQFVKSWDKNRYKELFSKYTTDPKAYRIYIPLEQDIVSGETELSKEIDDYIQQKGYTVSDYVNGWASKIDSEKLRLIKIGKILDHPQLAKKFANDPVRASKKISSQLVVISRHPYDIAGMSTDRGWTSCMELSPDSNRYIKYDIKEGSLVAYLIQETDKNISNPLARIIIKPFVNIDNSKDVLLIAGSTYGTGNKSFEKTVVKWVKEVNSQKNLQGMFTLNKKLYPDNPDPDMIDADTQAMAVHSDRPSFPDAVVQMPREFKKILDKVKQGGELTEEEKAKVIKHSYIALEIAKVQKKPFPEAEKEIYKNINQAYEYWFFILDKQTPPLDVPDDVKIKFYKNKHRNYVYHMHTIFRTREAFKQFTETHTKFTPEQKNAVIECMVNYHRRPNAFASQKKLYTMIAQFVWENYQDDPEFIKKTRMDK